jgi:addiction module HigA family antidote
MLHGILAEKRPLSGAMCLRLARLFGSTPDFWMRLQAAYDLAKASSDRKLMTRISRIVPVRPVAA